MRSGHYVETYGELVGLSDSRAVWAWTAALLAAAVALPAVAGNYGLTIATTICITAIGAIGLNLLTGTTGLISLGHSGFLALVANHPFVDGNKRIGAAVAELFLNLNDVDLVAGDDELVQATLAVARGEVSAEALAIWLRQRSRHRER